MDISAGQQTSMDIFKLIVDHGPLTLYSASSKSSFPLGTIHRHFKEMESSGKIKVYDNSKEKRRKKPYGPTFFGFVYYYRMDKKIKDRLENYFLLWMEYDDFLRDLYEQGFDIDWVVSNPKKSKELFGKYVQYGAGVEDHLEMIKKDPSSLPREMAVFIGELLVSINPSYQKLWSDLYVSLPGLRKNVDVYLDSMLELRKRLKKKIRR